MNDLYFEAIDDDIIREKLKLAERESVTYRYPDMLGKTAVTFFFTDQNRAAWIAKYKKEYYGSIISNVERQDEYTYIDVYRTLRENAIKTLKDLK